MSTIIHLTIATILFAISLGAILRSLRIVHATLQQRQIVSDIGGSLSSLGSVGCSILCSRINDIDQISALLSTEHDRYEVIVVLDANLYAEQVEQIIHHFKLIRVNTPDHTELPHSHIRTLYRSRQRCFRRLILIDQGFISPYDDMNAATAVASYAYLIPLAAPFSLRKDALDNIIITLAEHPDYDIDLIRSTVDGGMAIQRDILIEYGGFSPKIRHKIPRSKKLNIDFPLLISTTPAPRATVFYIVSAIIVLLCYLTFGPKIAVIALLTSAIIIISAYYASLKINDRYSHQALLYQIIDIRSFFAA